MIGIGGEKGEGWDSHGEDGLPEEQPFETTPFDEVDQHASRLPLGEEDRLPWLESPDDVDLEEEGVDAGRIVGLVVLGVIVLALVLGVIFWLSHRGSGVGAADGSTIEAQQGPYKVKPEQAGGKVFEGTGDTSFKVSEGLRPQGSVAARDLPQPTATVDAAPSPAPGKAPAAQASAAPAPAAPGVGVQVGAFSSRTAAEAAWSRYQTNHEALKGVSHRVVEKQVEGTTLYALQAVAGDTAAARALCSTLSASGLKCQVK